MRSLAVIVMLLFALMVSAQNDVESIVKIAGVSSVEEMDPDELERLEAILKSPIDLNNSTLSDLEMSGLFNPFQIVSLMDYRKRHGSVYSYTELSSIDGFSPDMVKKLKPFITICDFPAAPEEYKSIQDLHLRGAFKNDNLPEFMYGSKYRLKCRSLQFSISAGKNYTGTSLYSGNISWNHDKGKVLVGDFNARFGQGLCLWNSSINTGLNTPAAFMKKPSGISPTFSFTGSSAMTGMAADYTSGRWRVSGLIAIPTIKTPDSIPGNLRLTPALNLSKYGRFGSFSLTHYATIADFAEKMSAFRIPDMRTSCDASLCLRGVNVFAEMVYDWVSAKSAGTGGVDCRLCEWLRIASLLKYSPAQAFTNEYLWALSGEFMAGRWRNNIGHFSVETVYHPESKSKDGTKSTEVKLRAEWSLMATDKIRLSFKFYERLRTWGQKSRTDFRLDASYMAGKFSAFLRMNALKCEGLGLLGYVEGLYKDKGLSASFRGGAFVIDDWDDRIYVYERDAPGSFNVPAFYGRGMWAACYISWKYAFWGQICVRASLIDYIFMAPEKRKPGRAELKLQSIFRF